MVQNVLDLAIGAAKFVRSPSFDSFHHISVHPKDEAFDSIISVSYTHLDVYKRQFFIQSGAAPFIAPYTRDGRFGSVEAIAQDGTLLYDNRNPLIDASNGATKTTLDYMSLNAFATVDFTKDLNLQVTWASNGNWKMVDKYNETLYGYTDSGIETMTINYNRDGLEMSKMCIRDRFGIW